MKRSNNKEKNFFKLIYGGKNLPNGDKNRRVQFSFVTVLSYPEVRLLLVLSTLTLAMLPIDIDSDKPDFDITGSLQWYSYGSAIGLVCLACYSDFLIK